MKSRKNSRLLNKCVSHERRRFWTNEGAAWVHDSRAGGTAEVTVSQVLCFPESLSADPYRNSQPFSNVPWGSSHRLLRTSALRHLCHLSGRNKPPGPCCLAPAGLGLSSLPAASPAHDTLAVVAEQRLCPRCLQSWLSANSRETFKSQLRPRKPSWTPEQHRCPPSQFLDVALLVSTHHAPVHSHVPSGSPELPASHRAGTQSSG